VVVCFPVTFRQLPVVSSSEIWPAWSYTVNFAYCVLFPVLSPFFMLNFPVAFSLVTESRFTCFLCLIFLAEFSNEIFRRPHPLFWCGVSSSSFSNQGTGPLHGASIRAFRRGPS